MLAEQGLINHVVFVIDESSSMSDKTQDVIKAVDLQIAHLAKQSQQFNQETRVTIYVFSYATNIRCLVYDKDVLRLPSMAKFYHPSGNTALIDATVKSIEDLRQTATLYGDHSFLIFAFTDGEENASRNTADGLTKLIGSLPESWTLVAFVPNVLAKRQAQQFGFPKGNIAIWDTDATDGVEEASQTMTGAVDTYFTMRSSGITGTKTIFSTDATAVNATTIAAAGLQPLAKDKYVLVPVTAPKRAKGEGVENKDKHLVWEISEFVKKANGVFRVGQAYYELSKKERIQGNKSLAILEINTGKVFIGDQVRGIIGLPDGDKSVAPDFNPEYKIFVQSSSTNRHLVVGTKVLILK